MKSSAIIFLTGCDTQYQTVFMTIEQRLTDAISDSEIAALLNEGNNQRPSGKTRRTWLKIAAQKRCGFGQNENQHENQNNNGSAS